jgi:ABC-2 type transport system permease protein
MSFSQEGKNFWLLKASPASPRQMLIAKFLGAYIPALALGSLFLVVTSALERTSPSQAIYMLLALALCLAGLTGILISFGVAGANFKWDDPRRMNAGGLGCLGQIITMLYLPISIGLFIGPVFLALAFHLPIYYGYLIGAFVGVSVNLICAVLPVRVMERAVGRLDES